MESTSPPARSPGSQRTIGSRLPSRRQVALALAGVLALAAALRLPHLGYGLPGTTYVDGFRFVDEARKLAADGAYEPDDFMYPGLLKLLLAMIYGAFGVEGRAALYLVPRLAATAFDLGTVAVVFALARRLGGLRAAILAAGLHAASIIFVTSSRVESADAALAFFLTAALAATFVRRVRLLHCTGAGLLVGLAIGTKFSGVYGALALVFGGVLAVRQGLRAWKAAAGVAVGGVIALVTFLATTPWFLTNLPVFRMAIEVQAEAQRYGQIGHVQSSFFDYLVSPTVTVEQPWLASSLLYNLGPLVLVAGLAATLAALAGRLPRHARPRLPARLLGVYLVLFYVGVAGAGHAKLIRYLAPVLPVFSVLAGVGVARLLSERRAPRSALAWPLVAAALLAWPLARTAPYLAAASRPMTNELAAAWTRTNLPAGASVLLSPFYLDNLRRPDLHILNLKGAATTQYRLTTSIGVDTEQRPLYRPELVDSAREAGIEYVLLNSYFEGSIYDTEENRRWFPKTVAAYAAFRERLEHEAELVFSVRGQDEGRLGPDVHVYRLKAREPRSEGASPP